MNVSRLGSAPALVLWVITCTLPFCCLARSDRALLAPLRVSPEGLSAADGSLPLLADSKQNGEANAVLSDEEQPLSPADEEKRPMRRSSTRDRDRDKNKKSSTCFLLATGDFSCAADGGIQKGTAGGVSSTRAGRERWRLSFVEPIQDKGFISIPLPGCPLLPKSTSSCLSICLTSVQHISPCWLHVLFSPPGLGSVTPCWLRCPPWGQSAPTSAPPALLPGFQPLMVGVSGTPLLGTR